MRYVKQSNQSFDDINQLIWKHLEERDWLNGQPRNYATSIAIEAAELLEHYQWSNKAVGDKQAIANELADVLIYCFQFAMKTNIDMAEAIKHKLKLAGQKYPAQDYKGKTKEQKRSAWQIAHQKHRTDQKSQ